MKAGPDRIERSNNIRDCQAAGGACLFAARHAVARRSGSVRIRSVGACFGRYLFEGLDGHRLWLGSVRARDLSASIMVPGMRVRDRRHGKEDDQGDRRSQNACQVLSYAHESILSRHRVADHQVGPRSVNPSHPRPSRYGKVKAFHVMWLSVGFRTRSVRPRGNERPPAPPLPGFARLRGCSAARMERSETGEQVTSSSASA